MRVVALLAAVVATAVGGCGDDGAEPGASSEATLVLDFTPNAVHSGLYVAAERGWFAVAGLDLEIRPPGESTDAPDSGSRAAAASCGIRALWKRLPARG